MIALLLAASSAFSSGFDNTATNRSHTNHSDAATLIERSLEDLMTIDIVVTSASKREENIFDAAAASYVISAADISRSGVTSIPEALRMAPGVQVARINSSEWAIGIRGLNSRYSRYILVLVDGRSIYDPLFGGVNWDEINLPMADIDRIEVVRGAGGTIWGANAMNGVINIVTKRAGDVQGSQLRIHSGNVDKISASVQMGTQWQNSQLRASAYHYERNGFAADKLDIDEGDDGGQRLSLLFAHQQGDNQFELSADWYSLYNDQLWANNSLSALFDPSQASYRFTDEEKRGYALQGRWTHALNNNSDVVLRASYDTIERRSDLTRWDTTNTDIDIEWIMRGQQHAITAGVNSRFSESIASGVGDYPIRMLPPKERIDSYSLFIHDTIAVSKAWQVTAGARYEDNDKTDPFWHGTLRAVWSGSDAHRVWAAASRANTTPTRLNSSDNELTIGLLPASAASNGLPVLIQTTSDRNALDNATVDTYELGYRFRPRQNLSLGISAFVSRYKQLLSTQLDTFSVTLSPNLQPYVLLSGQFNADAERNGNGVEATIDWRFNDNWHLSYSGSYINFVEDDDAPEGDNLVQRAIQSDRSIPSHQHSLRLMGDIHSTLRASIWLRYTDELKPIKVDSYTTMDITVDYQPHPQWQLSLAAKNIGNDHVESVREAFSVDYFVVPAAYYAGIEYSF
jgi:iron complex outermembrane receptor protein